MGIWTIKPVSIEDVLPHLEKVRATRTGLNLRSVAPLTHFALKKNLRGPEGYWPKDAIGHLVLVRRSCITNDGYATPDVRIFKPGFNSPAYNFLLPSVAAVTEEENPGMVASVPVSNDARMRIIAATALADIEGRLQPTSDLSVSIPLEIGADGSANYSQ